MRGLSGQARNNFASGHVETMTKELREVFSFFFCSVSFLAALNHLEVSAVPFAKFEGRVDISQSCLGVLPPFLIVSGFSATHAEAAPTRSHVG